MSPSVINSNNETNQSKLQEVINNSVTLNNNSNNVQKTKTFEYSIDDKKLISLLTDMLNTKNVDKQTLFR